MWWDIHMQNQKILRRIQLIKRYEEHFLFSPSKVKVVQSEMT